MNPNLKKVDDALDVDMSFLNYETVELLTDKRQEISVLTKQIDEIEKEISAISQKSHDERVKIVSELNALTQQRDRNRKIYEQELAVFQQDLNSKTEAVKEKQQKELDRTYNELKLALKESEDFYAKKAGPEIFSDKQYRYNRGQVLVEEYGQIIESLEVVLSNLTNRRNQQIINLGKQIELAAGAVHVKAEESSDVNKLFKEELAKREKEHLDKIDKLNKQYAKQRAKYESDISSQIKEVKNMEEMYSNIHSHNKEKLEALEDDIKRLEVVISKSSANKEPEKDPTESVNSLIQELSIVENEIQKLKSENSQLREQIASNDSQSKLQSYLSN